MAAQRRNNSFTIPPAPQHSLHDIRRRRRGRISLSDSDEDKEESSFHHALPPAAHPPIPNTSPELDFFKEPIETVIARLQSNIHIPEHLKGPIVNQYKLRYATNQEFRDRHHEQLTRKTITQKAMEIAKQLPAAAKDFFLSLVGKSIDFIIQRGPSAAFHLLLFATAQRFGLLPNFGIQDRIYDGFTWAQNNLNPQQAIEHIIHALPSPSQLALPDGTNLLEIFKGK